MEKAIKIAIENGYNRSSHDYREMPLLMGVELGQPDRYSLCTGCGDDRRKAYNTAIDETRRGMYHVLMLLDPLFWQSLGKGLLWDKALFGGFSTSGHLIPRPVEGYVYKMHQFTDHLIAGKDIDSFFNELIK